MVKREKIMLGVMAATLVVATGIYFSGSLKPSAAPQALVHINLDEIFKTVDQAKLSPEQAYRIALLTDNATGDPFYGGAGGISQDDDRGRNGTQGELVYSGYIKVGQKLYAVLNGVEYARGDELAEGGYMVQTIDKNFVALERTDGSTGRKLTRRIPLAEDDTDKIRIRVVKQR